jgi:uncharacterized protein YbgA (DUF1722 family)/uncharacterized protein YbbK (DUF523 family)
VRRFPRPTVILSKCIEFEACRYNGAMIPSDVVKILMPHVEFRPVCPEVEIGLGVPRHPIRIIRAGKDLRLVQPETGRDLTDDMAGFVKKFLDAVTDVDGFVLKFRSPSCGMKEVRIYSGIEKGAASSKGAGFFGGAVADRFSGLAVEDEGRLKNFRIREHFLTRLFTLAAFREVEVRGKMRDLVGFQTENKLLLMAYSQKQMRTLGRLVANPEKRSVEEIIAGYRNGLEAALGTAPRCASCINVLMHAMGYFSRQLAAKEKAFFLDALTDFREQRIPLSVPVGILKSYIVRFDEPYLARQTFFEPYPDSIISVTDSGKGRSL